MTNPNRPHWQLPAGATRGLWDYIHSRTIAEDYDEYFAYNRLFAFDQSVALRALETAHIPAGGLVADLGCGTARALIPLVQNGYRGLAVDLSQVMLEVVREKTRENQLRISCLRANLCELDAIRDQTVDAAICLFSTLGMIRGRDYRREALRHARRILKPGGPLVLHVHNFWFNLYDPSGPWWLLTNCVRGALVQDLEIGDKFFDYRGVPNMFLHVFRRREILSDLRAARFQIDEVIPLDPKRHRGLRHPWLCGNLRANGWVIVCRR